MAFGDERAAVVVAHSPTKLEEVCHSIKLRGDKQQAIGVGKHNIRVNGINARATRTKRFEEMIATLARSRRMPEEEICRKLKAAKSPNRIGELKEIARAVVFLSSDSSSAITGHNLVVSRGFHLVHPQ